MADFMSEFRRRPRAGAGGGEGDLGEAQSGGGEGDLGGGVADFMSLTSRAGDEGRCLPVWWYLLWAQAAAVQRLIGGAVGWQMVGFALPDTGRRASLRLHHDQTTRRGQTRSDRARGIR